MGREVRATLCMKIRLEENVQYVFRNTKAVYVLTHHATAARFS